MYTSFCSRFASKRPAVFAHILTRVLVFGSRDPDSLRFSGSPGNLRSVEEPGGARSRRGAHLRLPPGEAGRRRPALRPAPARLIGCNSEGRRRGGRGGLISDADALLCSVVPDPAAAGSLGAARWGQARDSGSGRGSSGRPAVGGYGGALFL